MDVLTNVLSAMKLSGSVFLEAEFTSPWCVTSQLGPADCAAYFPQPPHVIAYHYVLSGEFLCSVESGPPLEVHAGQILLLPRNDRHVMGSWIDEDAVNAHELIQLEEGSLARIVHGGGGECVNMFCGFFGTLTPINSFLLSLPSVLVIDSSSGAAGEWLASSMRYASREGMATSPELVSQLAELLFVEAVRQYIGTLPEDHTGWLAGLRDSYVNKALSLLHARYSEAWTTDVLAREVGLSRSAFADRFATLLGDPPMRYLSQHRMNVAANMLEEGRETMCNIAYSVGFNSEAAFSRAFKKEFGLPPASWRKEKRNEAADAGSEESAGSVAVSSQRLNATPPKPPPPIQYCTARDGTGLAYSCAGKGPPLVKAANWLNHLEYEWQCPIWRHWLEELTRDHMLLRYDERGNGLSDWKTKDLSFEAFVQDLETVVDAAGLDRFDMIGISQGASVSIAYAVRHPERVGHLVLYGGYAMGWAIRSDPEEVARREAMLTLTLSGWGQDNPAFRQMFTSLYFPDATREEADSFNELQRVSASPEAAQQLQRALGMIDIRELLPQVRTPTLIFHSQGDAVVPLQAGQGMASRIPNARFVALESNNHLLLEHEPAWPRFVKELRTFLS